MEGEEGIWKESMISYFPSEPRNKLLNNHTPTTIDFPKRSSNDRLETENPAESEEAEMRKVNDRIDGSE
jgi:hypothetical protein